MKGITKRQKEIYDFVLNEYDTNNRPPTIVEIKDNFKFASNQAVVDHLKALEKKGYIEKRPKSRGIIPLKRAASFPIVGFIAAGQPNPVVENQESFKMEDFFDPHGSFILRVKGDSMINAGIHDGDFVVVKKTQQVEENEICVAIIDEEATVKRFHVDKGRVYLRPENPEFQDIVVDENSRNFEIRGKVVGLVRSNIARSFK